MANSSYEITQFRNLINEIKYNLKTSKKISATDRKLVSDLMQVLRYEVEFEILEECVSKSDIFTTLVANIDTKLLDLENKRKDIVDNQPSGWSKNVGLISIGLSKSRLNDLKHCIKDRNFSYYIEAMNRKVSSADSLIAICQEVLSSGVEDFNSLFGEGLVKDNEISVDSVNIVFAIMHNQELRQELEKYIRREKKSIEYVGEISNNEKYIKYLEIAKENEELLREYLTIRNQTGEFGSSQAAKYRDKISHATLEYDSLPSSGLGGVLHNRRRNELALQIEENQKKLEGLLQKRERRIEIEEELSILGLEDILKCYGQVIDGNNMSIEQKVAEFIKYGMKKNSFDITTAKARLLEQNKNLEGRSKLAESTMSKYRSELSFHARELIEHHHDDVVRVLDMLTEKKNGNITPVLATCVLKALVTARGFSYQEINEICELHQGADKLITSYENMVGRTIKNIEDSLTEVEMRDEYDFSEFGPIRL